jgi:DNA-directed RNA polymerase specialized sigma24 family protein
LRIGVNQALTRLRPNKKSFLFSDTADEDSLRSLDPAGYLPRSQIAVPSRELSGTIEKMIRVPSRSFQPAFEMRYLRELSNEEAAMALDMSTPAIKTRVFRARRQLRERFARQYRLTRSQ